MTPKNEYGTFLQVRMNYRHTEFTGKDFETKYGLDFYVGGRAELVGRLNFTSWRKGNERRLHPIIRLDRFQMIPLYKGRGWEKEMLKALSEVVKDAKMVHTLEEEQFSAIRVWIDRIDTDLIEIYQNFGFVLDEAAPNSKPKTVAVYRYDLVPASSV